MSLPYSPLPEFVTAIIWTVLALLVVRLSLATVIAAMLLGIRMILPYASPLREQLLMLAKHSPNIASVFVSRLMKLSFYGFIVFILVLAVMGFGT